MSWCWLPGFQRTVARVTAKGTSGALLCYANELKGPLNPEGAMPWAPRRRSPLGYLPTYSYFSENCPPLPTYTPHRYTGADACCNLLARVDTHPGGNGPDTGLITFSFGLNSFDCE